MNPILSAKKICKSYYTYEKLFSSSKTTFAASNVISLDVVKGENLGIIGQSGGGKTTLARILAGIIKPDSGEVFYKGQSITNSKIYNHYRKNVQMIFQNPDESLNPKLKVYSVLKDLLEQNHNKKELYSQALKLITEVGLSEEHLNRYPSELSGGQKQRVSIARALALKPEIIIADEPVSSLDVSAQAQILNLMKDLGKRFNITFVVISHDIAVVSWLCEKTAVIYQGNLIEYGKTSDIISNPQHEHTKKLILSSIGCVI